MKLNERIPNAKNKKRHILENGSRIMATIASKYPLCRQLRANNRLRQIAIFPDDQPSLAVSLLAVPAQM